VTEPEPEIWRTDPRERLLAAIDRTWARGVLGVTPEQLVDGYAHQLAEQIRNRDYDPGAVEPVHLTVQDDADLIDPKVEAQR
jgi:hypothetical protein